MVCALPHSVVAGQFDLEFTIVVCTWSAQQDIFNSDGGIQVGEAPHEGASDYRPELFDGFGAAFADGAKMLRLKRELQDLEVCSLTQ